MTNTNPARELSDQEIIEIRDSLLPSQGESFDTLAFARAVLAVAHSAPSPADDVRSALVEHELLPCPFCGGTDGDIVGAPDRGYWAMCDSCGASTSEINNSTEADAIAAWNRRSLAPQAPAAQPLPAANTTTSMDHPPISIAEQVLGIAHSAQGEQ